MTSLQTKDHVCKDTSRPVLQRTTGWCQALGSAGQVLANGGGCAGRADTDLVGPTAAFCPPGGRTEKVETMPLYACIMYPRQALVCTLSCRPCTGQGHGEVSKVW